MYVVSRACVGESVGALNPKPEITGRPYRHQQTCLGGRIGTYMAAVSALTNVSTANAGGAREVDVRGLAVKRKPSSAGRHRRDGGRPLRCSSFCHHWGEAPEKRS